MKTIENRYFLLFFCCVYLAGTISAQSKQANKISAIGLPIYSPDNPTSHIRNTATLIKPFTIHENHLRSNGLNSILKNHVTLKIDKGVLSEILALTQSTNILELWIPIEGEQGVQLVLEQQEVLSKDFVVTTSGGQHIRQHENIYPSYVGTIANIPNSHVSLSIYEQSVRMILMTDYGNFNLVKLLGVSDHYLMFNDSHVSGYKSFSCGVEDSPGPYVSTESKVGITASTRARNRVEVYLEIDFDAYQANGSSVVATRDWALGIFRDMVSIYERHSISLRLNEISVWTTNNDPFNGIGANFAELDTALKNWSATQTDFNGDVAHYMGTESGTNFVIGLANSIGEFCDKIGGFADPDGSSHSSTMGNSIPYIQLNSPASSTFGFDVPTWTMLGNLHELGHIFGANHTHACKWGTNGTQQIDDCGNQWAITNGIDDDGNGVIDDINDTEGADCFFAETPNIPSDGGTIMSYCNFSFAGSPQIDLSKGFHDQVATRMRNVINSSSCIGNYNSSCPETETIELDFSGTWDASKEVLIHDAEVTSGNSAIATAGNQVIIYGNFSCPLNAAFQVSGNGCSN